MFSDHQIFGDNLCLSGGAKGADLQWGMCAGTLGHSVIHWSFNGHRTQAPNQERVILTPELLEKADPFLVRANQTLKRSLNFNKSWVINLLRRNYYQVCFTSKVYAITTFKNGQVAGGTAWAVQMAIDMVNDGSEIEIFVFDQSTNIWMEYKDRWHKLATLPPQPSGIWTGIGTQQMNETGKQHIRTLLKYNAQTHT